MVELNLKPWFDNCVFQFADIVHHITRRVLSLESFQDKFSLSQMSHFSYLQICHFMQTVLSADSVSLPSHFKAVCRLGSSTWGLISVIYQSLIDPFPEVWFRHAYVDKWEAYLGTQLSHDTCRLVWRRVAKTSTCLSYKENQYKMLMFWYHTPSLLHQSFRYLRIDVWDVIQHDLIYKVMGIRVHLSPLAFLLNVPSCKLSHKALLLALIFLHILIAAKWLIAQLWKQGNLPSISDLHLRLKEIRNMEYLTTLLNNKLNI